MPSEKKGKITVLILCVNNIVIAGVDMDELCKLYNTPPESLNKQFRSLLLLSWEWGGKIK